MADGICAVAVRRLRRWWIIGEVTQLLSLSAYWLILPSACSLYRLVYSLPPDGVPCRQYLRFAESLVKLRAKLAAKENESKERIMRAGDRVSLSSAPRPAQYASIHSIIVHIGNLCLECMRDEVDYTWQALCLYKRPILRRQLMADTPTSFMPVYMNKVSNAWQEKVIQWLPTTSRQSNEHVNATHELLDDFPQFGTKGTVA